MKVRGGAAILSFFVLLGAIFTLQILSMRQSDRFYAALNRIEEKIRGGDNGQEPILKNNVVKVEYPGDDGDWLVWGLRVEPRTLNPISVDVDLYVGWITIPNIFEPLLAYDYDEIKLKPWLTESYEVSKDGLEITFRLRDNIYFSDGKPVTADDVIFTYETIVNPRVDAANISNLYIDVKGYEKVDGRTVKFYMKRPYFKALENLSFTWTIGILPKHIYQFKDAEEFNKRRSNPVGSGPYVFDKWQVGREIVLQRNENYWGTKPKLKKIVYKFITNPVASVQALRSHEVDIVVPEPEQFADLLADEEFKKDFECLAFWVPWTGFYHIGWNQDTPFFKDKRVRLAMTHIINRERITEQLLRGQAKTITSPFYIYSEENDPNIKPWPYDLKKAAELLDEAGWKDTDGDGLRDKDGVPFRFKFMYSNSYAMYDRLVKLLKDEAAQVGIEVTAEPTEWSILLGRMLDRKFDSYVIGWGGDIFMDFYQLMHSSQIENRGSNYVGFKNAEVDSLIEEIRQTLDEGRHNELCRRLHRILHEQQPYTFLFTRAEFRLVDKRFKNIMMHKLGPNYHEWYVPKEQQRYK